jgi:DNA-binding NtrC family response regulator
MNESTSTPRIFVIDDDVTLRSILSDMLREEGHAVAEFSTTKDAIKALDAGSLPAAVITDNHVEHEGAGLQLLREAAKRNIPRIIISGNAIAPAELIASGGSQARQLIKPFSFDTIISTLDTVVAKGQSL